MTTYWATVHGQSNLDQQMNIAGMQKVVLEREVDGLVENARADERNAMLNVIAPYLALSDGHDSEYKKGRHDMVMTMISHIRKSGDKKSGKIERIEYGAEAWQKTDKINALVDAINEIRGK
jgi:hypothetical protein